MGELFTPDSDIKVSKSPFALYANEEKIYDGRLTTISLEHIMLKVKRGHIYGADFVILEALSVLEFATSRMVTQYLESRGVDMPQMKVHNRLKFMNSINIISRFRLASEGNEIAARFYCLERAGKFLLLSRGCVCSWKQSDNVRPLHIAKKILARNQVFLTFLLKVQNIKDHKIKPVVKLPKSHASFKPDLQINLAADDTKESIFFEVVRSYDGCDEKFLEKLKQYQEFYEYFVPTEEMACPPQLVIIGEDDVHLAGVFQKILLQKIELKNMSYVYSTDLRVLGDEPSKAFLKFDLLPKDGGGYKAKIKILNYSIMV